MTAFAPIAFLDLWALSSTLRSKLSLFAGGKFVAREDGKWSAEMKGWNSLHNVITVMRRLSVCTEHDIETVAIDHLDPHDEDAWAWTPPQHDDGLIEAQAAIVTNPQCFLFAGTLWQHFPVGHLIAIDRKLPRCAVNWGEQPRYHLILQFRKKASETE